jgi:cysteine desulfurase/selenocysteine lyase
VSEGLNLFASSLTWEAGDNIVVCPELEHPNNIFLWYNLERRVGAEVRAVPPVDGRMPIEAMIAAMDERTRVVTFPTISFAPGFVTDIPPLVEAARRVGALTLADAAQSVGAQLTDVHALGIDALAVATQKCLLALYGYGFLYVRREIAEELVPIHVARYGIDLQGAHETAYAEGPIQYLPGARRFDVGNYNYLGMTAARVSLQLITKVGVGRIESHVRGLASRLATGLEELGLPVVGGAPGADLAHIVSVGTIGGGRHYTADDPEINDLHGHLKVLGMVFSLRSGVLRFSVGAYNDDSDIDRVLDAASEWVKRSGYRKSA